MWEVSVMKQIRKISNLIAEELESAGFDVNDAAFEEKVSEIVSMISESVKEQAKDADKKDAGDIEGILEEVEVSEVYMATADSKIGEVEVKADEFVEIEELDFDNGEAVITVYDAEGEVKNESVIVPFAELEAFSDSAEEVEFDEEVEEGEEEEEDGEEIEEAIHIKGGKKIKLTAAQEKLRKKLKAKKTGKVNKFTIKNGKIVRKSAEQIANDKKKSKTFAKKMKKFAARRKKMMKKAQKFSKKVNDGFDISSNGAKISVEEGDILTMEDGLLSVVREGKPIISGIKVSENFLERCVAEGVAEDEEVEEEDEKKANECGDGKAVKEEDGDKKVDEASFLTFKAGKGYVVIKEGTERPIGNRIRARACLRNEGFDITTDMLDRASEGKMVVL